MKIQHFNFIYKLSNTNKPYIIFEVLMDNLDVYTSNITPANSNSYYERYHENLFEKNKQNNTFIIFTIDALNLGLKVLYGENTYYCYVLTKIINPNKISFTDEDNIDYSCYNLLR